MLRFSHPLGLALLLLALVAGGTASVAAQDDAALADPAVGTPVSYVDQDGDELAQITVTAVTDPFEEFDESFSPERGYRYVGIEITVENTGEDAFEINPFDFFAQDDEGFLYGSAFVPRPDGAEPADLESGDVDPGESVTGFLGLQVFAESELVRVFFAPESDRLLVLADLRLEAGAANEPVIDDSTPESDD